MAKLLLGILLLALPTHADDIDVRAFIGKFKLVSGQNRDCNFCKWRPLSPDYGDAHCPVKLSNEHQFSKEKNQMYVIEKTYYNSYSGHSYEFKEERDGIDYEGTVLKKNGFVYKRQFWYEGWHSYKREWKFNKKSKLSHLNVAGVFDSKCVYERFDEAPGYP